MDFQQKKIVRKIIYSKITLFLLLVLVIMSSRAVWNIYQKEKFSRIGLEAAQKKYEELSSRKDFLIEQMKRLETEDGIEEEIRNKFSVAKKGEVSVLIIDKNASSDNKVNNIMEKSLWQKFLDLF